MLDALIDQTQQQSVHWPTQLTQQTFQMHSYREGAQAELQALQGAKQDLELGQAMLIDKLQQCKAENEQMVQQISALKLRITNSTQDYVSAVWSTCTLC